MTIKTVRLHLCRIGIGFAYATDRLDYANTLIVELNAGACSGWGEVFLPKVEPLWQRALQVAPLLIGQNAEGLDALIARWPQKRIKLKPEECLTYCHPNVDTAAEAFSIALHDLVARRRAVPFGALLGTPRRWVLPGMPVIPVDSPKAMAGDARAWARAGFRHVKIKLAGIAEDDVNRVRAIRAALGNAISIQADANGSYTVQTAEKVMAALNACRVEVVEDLYDPGDLEACRNARRKLKGLYMVDKDAYWPHVQKVLRHAAADIINIHPHNQGSMSNALRIAAAARAAGVESAVGSSGILGIQSAAYQHLAAVVGLTRPCEDIGLAAYFDGPTAGRYAFSSRPTVLKKPAAIRKGKITIPQKPGLGIEVDIGLLERFRIKHERFE